MGKLTVLGARERWWTLWSTSVEEPRSKSRISPRSSLIRSGTWPNVRSGWSSLTHIRNYRTYIGGPFLPFHVPRCAPLQLPHFPHDRADRLKCRSSTMQSAAPAVIGATPSTTTSSGQRGRRRHHTRGGRSLPHQERPCFAKDGLGRTNGADA